MARGSRREAHRLDRLNSCGGHPPASPETCDASPWRSQQAPRSEICKATSMRLTATASPGGSGERSTRRRVSVELRDGDMRLALVVADQFRSDLPSAGIGDGCYGYTIRLGDALLPNGRHVLRLQCADSGAEFPGFRSS